MCQNFFPLKTEYYSIVCIYVPHFVIYSSVDEHKLLPHSGYCENAAMNMSIQTPSQVAGFNYFEYIPQTRIAGSYHFYLFIFDELLCYYLYWLHRFT